MVGAVHHNKGLTGFDGDRGLLACVIQWPRSDIQWQTTNDIDIDVEAEIMIAMIDLDAEYEALCAEHSMALV